MANLKEKISPEKLFFQIFIWSNNPFIFLAPLEMFVSLSSLTTITGPRDNLPYAMKN